jgi:hypothetical protein
MTRNTMHRLIVATSIAGVVTLMSAGAPVGCASPSDASPENIYILRSIREQRAPVIDWCASSRTGFEPFSADAERFFSFWSVSTRIEDGRVVDAKRARVAQLRACFGPTQDRARQNFYAESSWARSSFAARASALRS